MIKPVNHDPVCWCCFEWIRLSSAPLALLLSIALSLDCNSQEADGYLVRGWQVVPRISVGATYSDNINLVAEDTKGDMVFQVDPGISVRKQGGRLNLRLDYTAQGLFYSDNGDANQINNNLLAFGTAKLYQNNLFLDAYGSVSQVPIVSSGRVDAGGLGSDGGSLSSLGLFNNIALNILPRSVDVLNPIGIFSNIALTDNEATQSAFGISPYWRQNIGGWAEALLRYRYDDVSYSGSDNLTNDQSQLFDSQINSVEFNLTSGHNFDVLKWSLNYFYLKQDDQQGDGIQNDGNDRQEKISGRSDYRLNKAWVLVAEAGYADNQSTTYTNYNNGPYWGLGATWKPNRYYSLTGLYGLNYNNATIQWNPSQRTNLTISRTYQGVGYNPGVYWNGAFSHRARFSVWSAGYTQEVTTSQQLASNNLTGIGPDGQPVALDTQGQIIPSDSLGLSNEQFLRKYFNFGMTYLRSHTGLAVAAFSDNREFQDPTQNEDMYGVGALWTWRFAPRTASFLGAGWGHDNLSSDQQNEYWLSVIGLARMFSPDTGGLISYRYYRNDADPADQGFRENRFNVRFSMKF
ncbi:MAG: TIGR03016 family PEP-CTERM system-associated outer membrane protein [Candidatus Competibacter sp.]|nr:TIGR03016 family PEP-CTERM system-associated outer membrane protein [Candidatus Competibacter sp.]MDG4584417.1 TIGR03016 family PEP-CTERM system-associated outer membrane protein [Candidatus Competibacter sp.]